MTQWRNSTTAHLNSPTVTYTPTFMTDLSVIQKQLAQKIFATVTSSLTAAHQLYNDGSITESIATYAIFSPSLDVLHGC